MNFSAVILAGGKSSRMGRDKAFLDIGGQTLLARQIKLASETGAAEVFISGHTNADYSAFCCRVLHDQFAAAGPLAGIERVLTAATSPLLLVLAVDLPEMNVEFLRRLAAHCANGSGAIPRVMENIEPLAAYYPKAAQPLAETLLCAGKKAVAGFAEQCGRAGLARFVDLTAGDARYFANMNTPADVHP